MLFPTSWKFYFHSFFHSFISFIHFYFWILRAHYAWERSSLQSHLYFYHSMAIFMLAHEITENSENRQNSPKKAVFWPGAGLLVIKTHCTFTLLFLVISFPNSQKKFSLCWINATTFIFGETITCLLFSMFIHCLQCLLCIYNKS